MKPKIHYTIRADHISHDQGRDRMQGPWDLQQSQSLHLGFSQLKLFGTRETNNSVQMKKANSFQSVLK